MSSSSEPAAAQVPQRELRPALERVLLEALPYVVFGLSLIYAFFAVVDPLTLAAPHGQNMGLVEGLIALFLFSFWLGLRRYALPAAWAHPVAGAIAFVILAETTYTIHVVGTPLQTTYLVLLQVGVGLFFLSWGWLALVLLSTLGAWSLVAFPYAEDPTWLHYGFTLLTATGVSAMVHAARMRTYRRLEGLRLLDGRRRRELEEAIRAVRQSEQRLRSLSEATFEGVAVHEDGRIIDVNPSFARLFGTGAAQVVGRSAWEFISADTRPRVLPLFLGESGGPVEAVGVRPDGSRVPVELAGKAIPYEGRTVHVIAVRDLTEQKRMEEANRVALERLMEIERLKEVNQFKTHLLNTASHELNTPLTALRLQLHLLEASASEGSIERQKRALNVLSRNVDRLSELVHDVLEVARLQSGRVVLRKEPMEFNAIVREVVESFEEMAGTAGVAIEVHVPDNLWVTGDSRRITQVMFNLLSNSLKFTPKGGRVAVTAERRSNDVEVRVQDTGIGIRPQDVDKLFQPFSQVHNTMNLTDGGTGLGLYITKGIVEQHGGRIWIESAGPGRGSTVGFTLPV